MKETKTTYQHEGQKKANVGYIIAFSLVLVLPSLVQLFGLNTISESNEKRELNEMPALVISEAFPQQFEAYYNDHFGWRNSLVSLNSKMKIGLFQTSPRPESVLLGKNGFMYYNDRNDDVYVSYSNRNTVGEKALEASLTKHQKLKETLAIKGITYIMAIWPNKHAVYPENLPLNMKMQLAQSTSLAEQITAHYAQNNFPIVDVRQRLLSEKKHRQLYFKFDSHWNAYGAFIAYQEFCKQTQNQLSLAPFDSSDFNITYSDRASGDLTNMAGIDEMFCQSESTPTFTLKDPKLGYQIIENTGYPERRIVTENKHCGNSTTAIVFRDSYGDALIPYLSQHYYKVIYIKGSNVDLDYIETTDAEIVMNLRVERYISVFL